MNTDMETLTCKQNYKQIHESRFTKGCSMNSENVQTKCTNFLLATLNNLPMLTKE